MARHEIPLRLNVQSHQPGYPLPQRRPHCCRTSFGVLGIAHPRHQVADVVHQPGHGKLLVLGRLRPQD